MKNIIKNIIKIWDKLLFLFGVTRSSVMKNKVSDLTEQIKLLKQQTKELKDRIGVSSVYDAKELLVSPLPKKVLEKPQNTPNYNFNKKVKVSKKGNLYRISIQANEFFVLTANIKKSEIEQLYIEIEEIIK